MIRRSTSLIAQHPRMIRIGQSHRTGRARRRAGRRLVEVSHQRSEADREHLGLTLAPAHECEPRSRGGRRPDVGERGDRIGEEHHPEARHDPVERRTWRYREKIVGLGVGFDDHRSRHSPPCCLDHRQRDVDPDRFRSGRHRGLQQRAGAAPDVDHAPRRSEVGRGDDRCSERSQHGIEGGSFHPSVRPGCYSCRIASFAMPANVATRPRDRQLAGCETLVR